MEPQILLNSPENDRVGKLMRAWDPRNNNCGIVRPSNDLCLISDWQVWITGLISTLRNFQAGWLHQTWTLIDPLHSLTFPSKTRVLVKKQEICFTNYLGWKSGVLRIIWRIKVRLCSKVFKDFKKFIFIATRNFWESLNKIMLRYQREAA